VQFYAVSVCRAFTVSTLQPARVDIIWLRTGVFVGLQEPTIDKPAVTGGGSAKLYLRNEFNPETGPRFVVLASGSGGR
jgi:hypothetical protein